MSLTKEAAHEQKVVMEMGTHTHKFFLHLQIKRFERSVLPLQLADGYRRVKSG